MRLHPVQQAMVDQHASQCGFCTPGFVMSLFALYLNDAAPTRDDVVDALAGNLCRCTGYRPIIDAGCAMSELSRRRTLESRRCAVARPTSTAASALRRSTVARSTAGFMRRARSTNWRQHSGAQPDSLILAGGTDVGLWVTKHLRELPPLVYSARSRS